MKLMFASDIHGSRAWCEKVRERFEAEAPERLILLGDLLYHGPRNNLPLEYDPKGVIAILNSMKEHLLCVRGNCDAEVDQMVLEFPIMADYMILYVQGRMVFLTHGRLFNNDHPPLLGKGDILLHGHTHVQAMDQVGDYLYINPGSCALPKEGNCNSYMIYEDGQFIIKDMDGKEVRRISIEK